MLRDGGSIPPASNLAGQVLDLPHLAILISARNGRPMLRIRRLLFWLAVANLGLAVLVNGLASFYTGLVHTMAISKYHQLEVDGVIDHGKLSQARDLRPPHDQWEVVDWLVGRSLTSLYQSSYWISGAFVANAVVLICAWLGMRSDRRSISSSTCDLLPEKRSPDEIGQ